MKISRFALSFLVVLATGLLGWSSVQKPGDAGGFVKIKPADMKWSGSSSGTSLQTTVLVGDPSKPGFYTIRVRFPAGVMSRPHFHSTDRFVTVLSGTWYMGTGEKFEPDKTDPMPAGSFVIHPAGAVHFDGAKDAEVVVQISGMGPVKTEQIR
jgi:quercetin dioxygenase-like cupin family protein